MGRDVRIIGVPTDFGTNRRGVDMGPSAIRYAGLIEGIQSAGHAPEDAGNVDVPRVRGTARERSQVENANHLDAVAEVCSSVSDEVASALNNDTLPLVIGGDHSIAIGSMAGSARDADIGVLWFDAHGDYNTPDTSPSGNVHGMPLAASLGQGVFSGMYWARTPGLREENVVWIGLRDLDDEERKAIRESNATAFTMSDIDERGIVDVVEDAIEIASRRVDGVHVSLDLDWLDPKIAPGVGTPVRGGVTYREAHAAMEQIAAFDEDGDLLRSMEVVEVNPILDQHNETAEMAVELVASALGKRVL